MEAVLNYGKDAKRSYLTATQFYANSLDSFIIQRVANDRLKLYRQSTNMSK